MPYNSLIRGVTVSCSLALGLLTSTPQETPPSPTGPTNVAELEAFMDGVMPKALETHHIAGGTVAIVQDGQIRFAKGYGFADVEKRTPVSADTTLFRLASVSKLFVWTAVMQLVEQGRLDLEADVNTYLKEFKLPATYPQPVTMRHLMTHTAGFEDRWFGLRAREASELKPIGQYLAEHMPARVCPPGEISSYSNHGAALAAHIVECISGMAWNDYVESRILAPLGMSQTTFRQPVPAPLVGQLSRGYQFADGAFRGEPFNFRHLGPAGGASSTAGDMARFMIAQLQLGRFGENRILLEATARKMQSPLFRHTPEVEPMAHGFNCERINGQRIIGHGGFDHIFFSELKLLPDHRLGFFVAFNSDQGYPAVREVGRAFMDHYFPADAVAALTPAPELAARLTRFAGVYRTVRYQQSDFGRLGALFLEFPVTVTAQGELETPGSKPTRWIQTAPLAFREQRSLRTLAFRENAQGAITHLFFGEVPPLAWERVPAVDRLALHRALFMVSVATFVVTILFWPVAAGIRRYRRSSRSDARRIPCFARAVAWLGALLFVTVAVGVHLGLGGQLELEFGIPPMIQVALTLALLAALLALATVLAAGWVWWRDCGTVRGRLAYTFVALALVVSTWQAWHWNLLTH